MPASASSSRFGRGVAFWYLRIRRQMKSSVMVPAVRSCSGSIMRRLVIIVMLMLR